MAMNQLVLPAHPAEVRALFERMRAASQKADQASKDWNRISDRIDAYCSRNGLNSQQRRQKRDIDWDLKDAYGTWNFWQQEVTRLAATLANELKLYEMIGTTVDVQRPLLGDF